MLNPDRTRAAEARPHIGGGLGLGLLLLAIDFTTKAIARGYLPPERLVRTAVPFFSWRLAYNTGSHYLLGSIGDWIPYRWVMAVAGAAVIALTVFLAHEVHRMPSSRVRTVQWLMVACLIGALGNALEVALSGRATDFFMIHPFPWPSNLCDQFVNATVFVLLPLSFWFTWRHDSEPPPPIPLSVLITASQEAATIGRAIDAFLPQLPEGSELLVVCPDPETAAVVADYAARYPVVRHVADPGGGKPAALNLGLRAAQGEILVLSDGDVVVAEDALAPLLAPFADPQVAAVSGHPVSISPRETMLGYWSHLLTDAAHQVRSARDQAGKFLVCSGYLFAMRRSLIDGIPEDALAEDAVISHRIAEQNYRLRYAAGAHVYVKYPTTYRDWLRQKVRSAGGYAQEYVQSSPVRMRSAWLEIVDGTQFALRYPRTPREFVWTLLLFAARLHLWLLVFINVRLLRRPLPRLWQRVETTK
jgi:glycosyltransferase involved in cell wall biosynthesis/lipoprotein signal peptidase